MRRLFPTAVIAIASLPAAALAQPALLSSTPDANAMVAKPVRLSLAFSETLVAAQSGIDLVMTGMPGMADHPPMPIKGFTTSVDGDGKTLVAVLPRALPAGSYALNWHVVGADQRPATGQYAFSVQ
jgi:methionine-rich copper-binding protein CopC